MTSSNTVLSEREMQLAHEAAEWRLISLLFECPCASWREQLSALASEVADADLKSAVEDARKEADEGLFHYTFGPGGPAPAREATYHQTVELGYLMSELQAYYNAFAFQPRTAEAPDHISVEVAFIAYLKLKELFALAQADEERAALAAEAAQRFMQEHLVNIAKPLWDRLKESGISYLYKAAASLSLRVGPFPGSETMFPILRDEDSEENMGCGEA